MNPSKVWTLILAAGESQRFGGPKALAKWNDGTLLSNAIDLANAVNVDRTMVVLGAHASVIMNALTLESHYSINPHWRQGIGSSLSYGVQEILKKSPNVDFIMVLPLDQPLISQSHLLEIIRVGTKNLKSVLTQNSLGTVGPPALISKEIFPRLIGLNPDKGIKSLLNESDYQIIENDRALRDADTVEELEELRKIDGSMDVF